MFAQMMIPHHEQAIDMSDVLLASDVDDAQVRDLAQRIGRPSATRAVGAANGRNPLPIVLPCHRVVRNDGALSGYRWGVERKRALLAREGVPHPDKR